MAVQLSSPPVPLSRREPAVPAEARSGLLATWLPLACVLLGVVSLFHLVQTSELTNTGYDIQQLQGEESNWRLKNEQLALEVARAKSLAIVETEATKRMGMVRSKEAVYLQPPSTALALRTSPASRGDARIVPELERPALDQPKSALELVQQLLSSALAPQHRGVSQ